MSKLTFPCLSFQLLQVWTFRRVEFSVWNKFLFDYFPPMGKFPNWKLFLCYCLGVSSSLPTLPWHFQKQGAKLAPHCSNPARDDPRFASTQPDFSFQLVQYKFTNAENNESVFSKHDIQTQCLSQEPLILKF